MTSCADCGGDLEPVFPDMDTDYQFDNALWISFQGGYAMFMDPMGTPKGPMGVGGYQAVLCHGCAHALCEAHPWVDALIQPLRSHAHTLEFWAAHPDHDGWDKKD